MELRIATCRPLPEPDPDEAPLIAALAARGVRARAAAWHDEREDWDAPLATIVRSTWDYIHRLDPFLAWIERAARAAPLWNPPAVLRWNAHKFYLRELAAAGFPIVPTEFVERGARRDLARVLADNRWQAVVIKPAVSAASFATLKVTRGELARGSAHLDTLLAERDVLVQEYAPAVETSGERALVWIDGELTHAVRKSPRFADGTESVTDVPIAADERELALAVLERFGPGILYARVDVVRDARDKPCIMELELIEPSLFLLQSARALEKLVTGLVKKLG